MNNEIFIMAEAAYRREELRHLSVLERTSTRRESGRLTAAIVNFFKKDTSVQACCSHA